MAAFCLPKSFVSSHFQSFFLLCPPISSSAAAVSLLKPLCHQPISHSLFPVPGAQLPDLHDLHDVRDRNDPYPHPHHPCQPGADVHRAAVGPRGRLGGQRGMRTPYPERFRSASRGPVQPRAEHGLVRVGPRVGARVQAGQGGQRGTHHVRGCRPVVGSPEEIHPQESQRKGEAVFLRLGVPTRSSRLKRRSLGLNKDLIC